MSSTDPQDQGEAFGFENAGNKDEKYNTKYLVANMEKEKRTGKLIVVGVMVAVVLVVYIVLKMAASTPHPLNAGKEGAEATAPGAAGGVAAPAAAGAVPAAPGTAPAAAAPAPAAAAPGTAPAPGAAPAAKPAP